MVTIIVESVMNSMSSASDHLLAAFNSAKWIGALSIIRNGTKSKGIFWEPKGLPTKCENAGSGDTSVVVGVAFGGGGELPVAASVGCEDEAVDGLGVGVKMMREELDQGVEGRVNFCGIRISIDLDSSDIVMGGNKEGLSGGTDSMFRLRIC